MPLYEIEYICNLSDEQQDKLAQSVTEIHSEKFKSVFIQPLYPYTFELGD